MMQKNNYDEEERGKMMMMGERIETMTRENREKDNQNV